MKKAGEKMKKFIVGVIGSREISPEASNAFDAGVVVAKMGATLLSGGGPGIMLEASKGAKSVGGTVVGILPSDGPDDDRYSHGYPNEFVDTVIYTGLGSARNAIIAKSSDLILAFPGGAGTLSEVFLSKKAGKKVLIFGSVSWLGRDLVQRFGIEIVKNVDELGEHIEKC